MNTHDQLATRQLPPLGRDGSSRARSMRRRRRYSLAEKLAIVRESQQAGVSQASVSRKHQLGKNVLWTWRKSLAGFSLEHLQGDGSDADRPDVTQLHGRIAELERLLGQKSFEIELLRNRLQGNRNTPDIQFARETK